MNEEKDIDLSVIQKPLTRYRNKLNEHWDSKHQHLKQVKRPAFLQEHLRPWKKRSTFELPGVMKDTCNKNEASKKIAARKPATRKTIAAKPAPRNNSGRKAAARKAGAKKAAVKKTKTISISGNFA